MSVNNLRLDNLSRFDVVSALTKIPSLRLADIDQHLPVLKPAIRTIQLEKYPL